MTLISELSNIKVGDQQVDRVFAGGEQVWPHQFKPSDISGMSGHWDASLINEVPGTNITILPDSSSNGRDLTVDYALEYFEPAFWNNHAKGLGYLGFNGSSGLKDVLGNATYGHIFIVANCGLANFGDNGATGHQGLIASTAGTDHVLVGAPASTNFLPPTGAFEYRKNGVVDNTMPAPMNNEWSVMSISRDTPWAAYAMTLGVNTVATVNNYWSGSFGEIIAYDHKLTPEETAQVEEYLSNKWLYAWDPTVPSSVPGLVGWWDPSTLKQASGTDMLSLYDKSNNNRALTADPGGWESGDGYPPTFTKDVLTGMGYVRYASQNVMKDHTGMPVTYGHIFVVGTHSPSNAFYNASGLINPRNPADWMLKGLSGTDRFASGLTPFEYRKDGVLQDNLDLKAPMQHMATMSVSRDPGWVDPVLTVGLFNAHAFSWSYWTGTVGEIIAYDHKLTEKECRKIEEYLSVKWGTAPLPPPPPSWSEKWGTLVAEYDMSELSCITSSAGAVSAIAPVAGPGPVLDQASSVSQPHIDTRTLNGKPVLHCDAQYVKSLLVPSLNPSTVAIICQWDAVNLPGYQVAVGDIAELYARYLDIEMYDGNTWTFPGADTLTHTFVCCWAVEGGVTELWKDGVKLTPNAVGTAGNQKLNGISLGSDLTGSYNMRGTIAHVVVYDGIVADPVGLSDELQAKWFPPAPPVAVYDASDPTSITSSAGLVSQWSNKLGATHLAQANAAMQPSTGTKTQNGKNVIDFVGPDHPLVNTQFNSLSSFTMFGVFGFGPDDWMGPFSIIEQDAVEVAAEFSYGGGSMVVRSSTNGFYQMWALPRLSVGLYEFRYDAATHVMSMLRDGEAPMEHTLTGGTGPMSPSTFTLGEQVGWTNFQGVVGEIRIFDRVLRIGSAESNQLRSELKTKWGTP